MVDFLTVGAWLGSMESAASTLGAPAELLSPVEAGALLLTVAGVAVAEEPLLERTRDGNSVSLCSGEGSSLTACADWFSKKSSSAPSLLSSESRRVELVSIKSLLVPWTLRAWAAFWCNLSL